MILEMPEKARLVFEELKAAPADDYDALSGVRDKFHGLLADDPSLIKALYDAYFCCLRIILTKEITDLNIDETHAYKFIMLFSSPSTTMPGRAKDEAFRVLIERHHEHKKLLEVALTSSDRRVTTAHNHMDTGNLGDIPTAMLELYIWHQPLRSQVLELEADLCPMISRLFRAFPSQRSTVLAEMMMKDTDGVILVSDLLRFYILDRSDVTGGPMPSIALNMLGHHAWKTDLLYVRSADILALTLRDSKSWPEDATTAFVEKFILEALDVETTTQAKESARLRDQVASIEHRMKFKKYKSERWGSAEAVKNRDVEYLEKCRKELDLIESDFERWNAQRWKKAVRRVAVSAITRKALKASSQLLPVTSNVKIVSLLNDALDYKNKPKTFPMPKAAENRFKDFGLKLLVIEELMYRQKILTPVFDIHEFAKEYEKREIDIESDGYDIIPEAKAYFQNLAIPDDLLSQVETLHQSSGIDGGSRFLDHLFPFWDPGAGDEVIKITNKAINDLMLLPNLKRLSGLENSKPTPKLLKALANAGVQIVSEESV